MGHALREIAESVEAAAATNMEDNLVAPMVEVKASASTVYTPPNVAQLVQDAIVKAKHCRIL